MAGLWMHRASRCTSLPATAWSLPRSIRDYGADIIRLWVASSDYTVDVRAGKEIFRQLSEAYRKMRQYGPLSCWAT